MKFFIVDVFAERKYQGNPLAVFVHDRELNPDEMQTIAKEVHFSECTFVRPQLRDGGFDVRIFTPDMEVPFAGHPTLGTAYVIRELLGWSKSDRIVLNEGVGQIPVAFADGKLTMEQKPPRFDAPLTDTRAIAEILTIALDDLDDRFPIQNVSTGLPSVIVPLRSLDAVRRCVIRRHFYAQFLAEQVKAALLVFTTETVDANNDVHVRVFVDDEGFFEDPATGSANGNLAAYLVQHRYFGKAQIEYRVEQGYEMGRRSLLHVAAEERDGAFVIRVGGRVFPVAEGEWL